MNIEFEKLSDGRIAISPSDFENILDILEFDKAKSANEETFPLEIVERLLEGESPLRVFREYRGYTQLEKGEQKGSIYTWKALASTLDVDIVDLV